ncbi:DUF4440 domain-containing protein [Bacillus sinesaloumensis]|uniref:nuclear transport factor 2 family protein n=1 Tax=Litchfieldia sinesaloumensis TaxID=1926280 RepID=UPI000988648F|nr:DUF4440 domain-containing protein [Bacillus sinesaloumensis]
MEYSLLEKQILNLEKRLMKYEYTDFIELLADDFLEFGSSGKPYDKEALLTAVKGINTNSIKYTVTDFKINLLTSDVLLATYKTFRHNDTKYALRSSIWKKRQDKWQIVFHQGTPTN